MKLSLKLSFLLFILFSFSEQTFSLTFYQIKKFCEKENRPRNCIKDLREKKTILEKGHTLEIPVIPHKR